MDPGTDSSKNLDAFGELDVPVIKEREYSVAYTEGN